jgi:hypothetical protein
MGRRGRERGLGKGDGDIAGGRGERVRRRWMRREDVGASGADTGKGGNLGVGVVEKG